MVLRRFVDDVVEACHLKFFLSANDGCRMYWPFRMQPTHEASSTYSEASEVYIIDSAIARPRFGNKEVLDKAHEIGADVCLLADYLPFDKYKENEDKLDEEDEEVLRRLREEYDDHYQASVESVIKGMDMYEEHPYSGEILVPLQPPHTDFWHKIGEPKKVAIGGVKDDHASVKADAALEVRDAVGEGGYVHGLGYGATDEIVDLVRRFPDVLDSIDTQSPFRRAMSFDTENGDDRMSPIASHAQGFLLEKCRRMSDLIDDEDEEESEESLFGEDNSNAGNPFA